MPIPPDLYDNPNATVWRKPIPAHRTRRGRERRAEWWGRIKIDECDAHLLTRYTLSLRTARGRPESLKACVLIGPRKTKTYTLARLIMDAPEGMVVDHINGDIFDNRRANLRVCTRAENSRNRRSHRNTSSRYRGVSRHKAKWQANVALDGKIRYLGVYETEDAAARAYDAAARELHGQFAALNFPEPGEAGAVVYDDPQGVVFIDRGEIVGAWGFALSAARFRVEDFKSADDAGCDHPNGDRLTLISSLHDNPDSLGGQHDHA